MLFPPSNIIPDVLSGLEHGVKDVSKNFVISWQVNGNTPMVAYEIFFFENNAASTSAGHIPKTTITPFSGINYKGEIQRYSMLVTSGYRQGLSNGNSYKMLIRQYYSANDYTDQQSLSVFYARATPSLSITINDGNNSTVTTTLPTRNATFTGSYSQAQGDALSWVNWKLYAEVESPKGSGTYSDVLLKDTGKIYGTSELRLDYDGFLNGEKYKVELSVETSLGATQSASQTFATSWASEEIKVDTAVCKLNNQSTAMRVTWGGSDIPGVATGMYTIKVGILTTKSGTVTWNTENGSQLSIDNPWLVMFRGTLKSLSVNIFKVQMSSSYVSVAYDLDTRSMVVDINGVTQTLTSSPLVSLDSRIVIALTHEKLYLFYSFLTGGLTPSASLTPSTTLVPETGTVIEKYYDEVNLSYIQHPIVELKIGSPISADYFVVFSNYTQDELSYILNHPWSYNPSEAESTSIYFLADFTDGLNAGSRHIGTSAVTGWSVYRQKEDELIAVHVADTSVSRHSILDYGCGSNEGDYHYLIYPTSDTKMLSNAIITRSFNPCFENWSLLETTRYNENIYSVTNEFIFGKNLKSGTISNNNEPTVYKNFTQYPTVLMATSNYQSGTLSSLIGYITYCSYIVQQGDTLERIAARFHTTVQQIIADNDNVSDETDIEIGEVIRIYYTNGAGQYFDDKALRDSILNLATTSNTLFLKSRKGDVMKVRISQDITFEYNDNAVIQPVTISIPWVQTGDATHTSIIGHFKYWE